MSFIARIAPVARTASAALKPTAPSISIGATRALSSSACLNKGPVESAKDTLKAADRTVSDAAVKGIEVGGTLFSSFSLLLATRNYANTM
ncbi:hypothetical protein BP00DRAFT_424446 [Aspergillus indologenus CBS 114.80]|uniref:Uncharacterized protein n=1 Tax=Aspergillus indologenus CBS 114.80 TaxID=1450541 RepID=A0A2V5IFY4_9EURO|nr:hypothetical protein BP00DRAFT_424446 [Aspergillus indologenus CBS 114.80]